MAPKPAVATAGAKKAKKVKKPTFLEKKIGGDKNGGSRRVAVTRFVSFILSLNNVVVDERI